MTKLLTAAALGLALAACNNSDHTIVADPTDDGFNAAAENVVLPPPVQASKTYRCADDTIVHVDWLADGKSATVRVGEGSSAVSVAVAAAEAGQPMSAADGTTLEGTADSGPVRVTLPGKPAQSCKA